MILKITLFIALFLALLSLVTWLTNQYTKTKEIGNTQLLIALSGVAIALLISKEIKSFAVGDFKVENAIREAQNTPIYKDVTQIPLDALVVNEKEDYYSLNQMALYNKPDALSFDLGYDNYDSNVINQYLVALGKSNLKYVVFNDLETYQFAGVVEYTELRRQLNPPEGNEFTTDEFKGWIENSDQIALKKRLKGFISKELSVVSSTKKLEALEKMEKNNLEYLPVIDSLGVFTGIVKRDRLASSVLIEVSKSLQTSPTSQTTQ